MTAQVIHPPHIPASYSDRPSVFLAGSIEMGRAVDWQTALTAALADLPILIYNPRRPDWDSSWKQEASNPQFAEQVNWELNHLAWASIIPLYFDPATKSPISLLELGLHVMTGRVIPFCPPGFWRKGNVDIVCARAGVTVYEDEITWTEAVRTRLVRDHLPNDRY